MLKKPLTLRAQFSKFLISWPVVGQETGIILRRAFFLYRFQPTISSSFTYACSIKYLRRMRCPVGLGPRGMSELWGPNGNAVFRNWRKAQPAEVFFQAEVGSVRP